MDGCACDLDVKECSKNHKHLDRYITMVSFVESLFMVIIMHKLLEVGW